MSGGVREFGEIIGTVLVFRHVLTEFRGFNGSDSTDAQKVLCFGCWEAYRRRMRTVDQLILACFVLGMSTRKVSTALFFLVRRAGICFDGE